MVNSAWSCWLLGLAGAQGRLTLGLSGLHHVSLRKRYNCRRQIRLDIRGRVRGSPVRHALAVILLFVLGSAQAAAVTIDFEEFSASTPGPVVSQGYSFSGAPNSNVNTINIAGTTTAFLDVNGPITLEHAEGELFQLFSLDLGLAVYTDDTFFPTSAGTTDIVVTGFLASGGTLQQSDSLESFQGITKGFSGWNDLTRVEIEFTDYDNLECCSGLIHVHSLDNVVVSTIPIPAAVWLFVSGLGLLGWFRRRQIA